MDRRNFVKKVAQVGLAVGFPTIIPSSALGKNGAVAPSERVNLGSIGLGTQGTGNTGVLKSDKRVQLVALCDVNNTTGRQYYNYDNKNTKGLQAARKQFGMDIPWYTDYREVLARKDIDALQIALPDHWHGVMYQQAVAAGKDVFGEKPLTRTIEEGIAIRNAVEGAGVVWQTGSWQRSLPDFVKAAELVRNGHLGKVHRIVIGLPKNFKAEILQPEAVPEGFDWEMWQGPAPRVDYYNPRKTFTRWRGMMNYSAGKIADWGAHHLDIAHWALGLDNWGPDEIVPTKVEWPTDGFSDQPATFKVTFYYKKAGVEIEMADTNPNGVRFFGEKGELFVARWGMDSKPYSIKDARIKSTDERVFPIRAGNHFTAFIDSVLDRRRAVTDIAIAHRTNTGCLLAEIAYRLNRPIKWNPETEKIIGDEQAARMCGRTYAAPYQLNA